MPVPERMEFCNTCSWLLWFSRILVGRSSRLTMGLLTRFEWVPFADFDYESEL